MHDSDYVDSSDANTTKRHSLEKQKKTFSSSSESDNSGDEINYAIENRGEWGPAINNLPQVIPFSKSSGINPALADMLANGTPEDFYFALMDDNIFQHIADQTNIYATQTLMNLDDITPSSRIHKWTPTDLSEIKRLFGLILYMGIVKIPNLSCYWSQEKMFKNSMAPDCMSRNRFELLLRMLHFANNEENYNADRLHKVQIVIDKIVKNFMSCYEPSEYVCVDESLIPFRGRLVMRQYIKTKRHKYGIKLFKLCSQGGYTYNLSVYAGKNLEQVKTTPSGVVLNLCEPLLDSGRTLVVDNWYTSLPLAETLLNRKTHLIGTIRKNRKGLPKELIQTKLKVGEVKAMQNQRGISVIMWRDKRIVLMLSTKNKDETVEVQKRGNGTVKKPKVILDYNSGKSSVDITDQMGAYQTPLRKSVKWYRKLAFEIFLNTAMINARILYNETTHNNMSMLDFRKAVTYALCDSRSSSRDPIEEKSNSERSTPTSSIYRRKRKRHEMGQKPYNQRKPCQECYKKAKLESGWKVARNLKKIRTFCQGCDDEPYLCLDCFNKRHRYVENP